VCRVGERWECVAGRICSGCSWFADVIAQGFPRGQLTLMIEDDRPSTKWSHTPRCRPRAVVVGVVVEEEEETK